MTYFCIIFRHTLDHWSGDLLRSLAPLPKIETMASKNCQIATFPPQAAAFPSRKQILGTPTVIDVSKVFVIDNASIILHYNFYINTDGPIRLRES